MCVTETLLEDYIPYSSVSVPGFLTIRADKDLNRRNKCKGGGLGVDGVIQDMLLLTVQYLGCRDDTLPYVFVHIIYPAGSPVFFSLTGQNIYINKTSKPDIPA
ncbi:hypothetical protein ILYODFUR_017267 [Ilyodon furcidens]|uniref:Uncharacterized protein n=1 Tax=Ilyodon furcidens TaxID=33524 RepID=A0ABV0SN58_9TELE